ncbi:MAG: hydrogen peroxide-inducible genes activator [Alphaproteobacteria bacterium]|nr:hydrogen peroxide-inducible genes activator [Alphaproteobacteria bacterium]
MSFRNPDFTLRQLQYAVAIQETGGFGAAAEVCGVSQPSLSAQVAKLEDVLGVTLFERHARGVHVTLAGEALLARMRAVLDHTASLETAAHTLDDPWATPVRVGVIPTVAPYLLPRMAERIRKLEPRPRVHWLELQTAVCEEQLASGDLDAALIADPTTTSGTEDIVVGWEPFRALVPSDHALKGPVSLDQLADDELMLLDDGHCLRDHTLAFCGHSQARESPYRATSLPTLVQMVAAGLGVSVIPETAVDVEVGRAPVRALPFREEGVGRSLHFVFRSRSPRSDVLLQLAEIARESLGHP